MTQYPITESRLSGRQLVGLVVAAAAAVVVAFVVAHAGTGVAMMKAAGLTGGTAISGVANFVSQIKDHIIWLAATATALMAAVIGFLFMSGHSRAQDYAIKGACGMLIIVAVPGIVS